MAQPRKNVLVVTTLVFASVLTACGSKPAAKAHHVVPPPPPTVVSTTFCNVYLFVTRNPAVPQFALGEISLSTKGNGSGYTAQFNQPQRIDPEPCGNTLVFSAAPINPKTAKFTAWNISGDNGVYNNTTLTSNPITITVKGDTYVMAQFASVHP